VAHGRTPVGDSGSAAILSDQWFVAARKSTRVAAMRLCAAANQSTSLAMVRPQDP